jgi:hypothetical protein
MWWSLREISNLMAPAFDDPSNPSLVQTDAGATISRLNALLGTQQSSFRAALNAVVFPIELPPLVPPDQQPAEG